MNGGKNQLFVKKLINFDVDYLKFRIVKRFIFVQLINTISN